MALYLSTVASPKLCQAKTIYVATTANIQAPVGYKVVTSTSRAVDGNGWVPVNLTQIPGGSPLLKLPLDPGPSVYAYACDPVSKTIEFNTRLMSGRFSYGGSDDKTSNDGGDDPKIYEVGTDPGLDLIPNGFWNNIPIPK